MATTERGLIYFAAPGDGSHALTTRSKLAHAQCSAGTAFYERVRTAGGGETVTCFDAVARPVRTATLGFAAGTWIRQDTEYDAQGRLARVSEPHLDTDTLCQKTGTGEAAPQTKCWTATDYDLLDRVTRITQPDGSVSTMAYDRLSTTLTDAKRHTRKEKRNALGESIETEDPLGGTVAFSFDAQGNVTSTVRTKPATDISAAPASLTIDTGYDLRGRRTTLTDPDTGTSRFHYNAYGELLCEQGAAGHYRRMTYDDLGRLASRKDYGTHGNGCGNATDPASTLKGNATWSYDSGTGGLGRLASVADAIRGYRKNLTYDRWGRLRGTEITPGTGNGTHYEKTTYDAYGRVFQFFDASRTAKDFTDHGVRYVHNAQGYLHKVQDAVGTETNGVFTPRRTYRTIEAQDARGHITATALKLH